MTCTKDEFEKLYARFTESGLSIRDFCFNEGIPESRFYYWKKRVIQEPKYELQKADGSFLPVNVTHKDGKITMRNRTNYNHTQPSTGCLWDVRAVMLKLLFFHYDHGSRAQKVAPVLFHGYKGALQTDGYGVYEAFENKAGILLHGC